MSIQPISYEHVNIDQYCPNLFFDVPNLRSCLHDLCLRARIHHQFKPKVFRLEDFILVKFYALVTESSTAQAAEELNNYGKQKKNINQEGILKPYKDGVRHRRIIPHQTEVDKFFRRLSQDQVETVFKGLLDIQAQLCQTQVMKKKIPKMLIDNTKYPYYGAQDPKKHINHNKFPGTKYGWFFQGIQLHYPHLNLYVDTYSLTKGKYRLERAPETLDYLSWTGLSPEVVLMDREFYRVAWMEELRKRHIDFIIPAILRDKEKQFIDEFLCQKKDVVRRTFLEQSAHQYPYQQMVILYFAIVGKEHQDPNTIRTDYTKGSISLEEAKGELRGFYTSMKPWHNKSQWIANLTRLYKERWNIETGFSNINMIHFSFRARKYTVRYAEILMRMFIYNHWAINRYLALQTGMYARDVTLPLYERSFRRMLASKYFA